MSRMQNFGMSKRIGYFGLAVLVPFAMRQDASAQQNLPDWLVYPGTEWETGMNPSNSSRQKVAGQLLRFFKTDPTARSWFLNSSTSSVKI